MYKNQRYHSYSIYTYVCINKTCKSLLRSNCLWL